MMEIAQQQDGGDGIQEVEGQPRPLRTSHPQMEFFGEGLRVQKRSSSEFLSFFLVWQLEITTLYHSGSQHD